MGRKNSFYKKLEINKAKNFSCENHKDKIKHPDDIPA